VTEDKSTLKEVETRISDLPDDKFLKVVELLQMVQSRPEVLQTMSQARPRLSRMRPPRPPTAQRVFYSPVEDLLSDDDNAAEQGRVSRDLMRRCWLVLKTGVPAQLMQAWEQRLAASKRDRAKVRAVALEIWTAAGAGLTTAVASIGDDYDKAVHIFGPDAPVDTASAIAGVYRIAEEVENLKLKFPDIPVPEMEEEDVALVQETLLRIKTEGKGDAALLVWVLSSRMQSPLSFMRHFPHDLGDGTAVGAQLVGGSLAHLEGALRRVEKPSGGPPSLTDLAASAEQLVAELSAARELAGPAGSKDPRLQAIGGKLKTMLQQKVLANAEQDVLAIVPKIGPDGDMTEALSKMPTREDLVRAEERVRAVRKAAKFGGKVGLGEEPAKMLATIKKEVETYLTAMLDHLQKNPGDASARGGAEQHVFNSARMIELADGPSAGYEILKKGQEKLEKAMPKATASEK